MKTTFPPFAAVLLAPALALGAAIPFAAPAFAQLNQEPRVITSPPPQIDDKPGSAEPFARPDFAPRPAPSRHDATPKPAANEALPTFAARDHLTQLYFDTADDGAIWVRGRTYKARFGGGGATYIPFLGSHAPRNYPVALSLSAARVNGQALELTPATTATRNGDRITIERGPIDEVYELALDHVEQTFVVAQRPAGGDLRLFVTLASELARTENGAGIELTNEHGGVRYGLAFARESNGTRTPLASRSIADGVEITISADYLASAEYPLIVDPIVSTFDVDVGVTDVSNPDTAFDVTTGRYLVVYEETFSASDIDAYAQYRSSSGAYIPAGYIDTTSENWHTPKCANLNNADQFLIVAECSNVTGSTGLVVRARTLPAGSFAPGARFNVSTTDQTGEKFEIDVGGDPYEGASSYCVTWTRHYTSNDWDIHARLVRSDSTLVGSSTILIDNSASTLDWKPQVSKSDGQLSASAVWNITWHRGNPTTAIRVAQLRFDGTIITPSTSVHSSAGIEYRPCVSSPLSDGRYLVVWTTLSGSQYDLAYALMSGGNVLEQGNLSALEAPPYVGQWQDDPAIDCDGSRFVVSYLELFASSSSDFDAYCGAFVPFNNQLRVVDAHQTLDFSGNATYAPEITSTWSSGGGARRFFSVWQNDLNTGTDDDIRGGLYDRPIGGAVSLFCAGDGTGGACPCGNNGNYPGSGCANSVNAAGATLNANGNAAPAPADTLSFVVTGVPVNVACTLFQGTIANPPSIFGDGLRCTGGSVIRIGTKSSTPFGTSAWPSGADAPVSVTGGVPGGGGERFYQVSYRNSATFCTSATFNISSGLRVTWLP